MKTCSAAFGQKCATVNIFIINKENVTIVAAANLEIHVGVSSRDLDILPLPCAGPSGRAVQGVGLRPLTS